MHFEPAGGKGPTAAATIIDGHYEVRVMPGKKSVRISGGKVVGKHRITPGAPLVDKIQEMVPECYNSRTTLKCDIVRGQTAYDFALSSSTP